MYNNIDELIDINLKLLFESRKRSLMATNFRNDKYKSISDFRRFAEILDKKKLINFDSIGGFKCDLTEFGFKISKNGGWLKHIKEKELIKKQNELKDKVKESLESENLKLQNENLEYQKSNRVKEEKIRELTIDNLRLGNWDIRFRWYIAIGSFIVGFIIKYFIDK